jgi:3-hydroxybutyryl-CoA dehydrogenase
MRFDLVGVVGAGVMGSGMAQNLVETGHRVVLVDLAEQQLQKARDVIRANMRMQAFFKKKVSSEEVEALLRRICFTAEYARLSEANFIIENVTEKWTVKQEVYRRLDLTCHESCIFGANTSAISITRIGSVTQRPDRVVGLHFMNPVPLKSMVEVIRGYHTSEATLEKAKGLAADMEKECIVVNDMPGFVSNRLLMLTVNEAIYLVQDQVATPENVDRLCKGCFGHKMGPLETADLIGLDTILDTLEVLHESYNDNKYRPCPLLRKMVHAGLHGCKTGRGFYTYEVPV